MLQVEESERGQIEREARELTDEVERLAALAAEAAVRLGSRKPTPGRVAPPRSTPTWCTACLPAPNAWTRHWRPPRPLLPVSTHRCVPASMPERLAPAS